MYITLNLCRVLAYLKDDLVLSKKAGGEWGVSDLPEYTQLIGNALACYESEKVMEIVREQAVGFAEDMLMRIRKAAEK